MNLPATDPIRRTGWPENPDFSRGDSYVLLSMQ
jgi:hypothetical protein